MVDANHYGYDSRSRMIAQTDGRGVELTFDYDHVGRVKSRSQDTTTLAEYNLDLPPVSRSGLAG